MRWFAGGRPSRSHPQPSYFVSDRAPRLAHCVLRLSIPNFRGLHDLQQVISELGCGAIGASSGDPPAFQATASDRGFEAGHKLSPGPHAPSVCASPPLRRSSAPSITPADACLIVDNFLRPACFIASALLEFCMKNERVAHGYVRRGAAARKQNSTCWSTSLRCETA